jgi:ubiquinone biosynthesis protein
MSVKSAWLTIKRLGRIVHVLSRHGGGLAGSRLAARWPALARLLPAGAFLPGPERLRLLFEDLGGTFVKFGQMLALQPDILPLAYCDALLKLLDRIDPFPWADAERIFSAELGKRPEEVFDDFDRRPIATASVGQVYAAHLGGRKVAVKIQRPGVEIEFANDIRLMQAMIAAIRTLGLRKLQWLVAPTSEFVAWSAEELDYRFEARYATELGRHAVKNPIQQVPAVYDRYTSRRTLVADFLDGVTLLDYLRARDQGDEVLLHRVETMGFDRGRFAANVIANFMGDAFRYGIYHADLHPANLMILPDNVVGYIDFGITGLMSHYSRRHLVAMTLALAEGDLDTIYFEYLKITSHDATSDLPGFRAALERQAETWYVTVDGERRLGSKITRIFSEMLQLSRQSNVMPERDIVKYIRSAIAIDGLLARFEPSFELGAHLAESCRGYLKWEERAKLLTSEHLREWSAAAGRLLYDGPARASRAFGQRLEREPETLPAARESPETPEDAGAARAARSFQLAAAVFGVTLLFSLAPGPLQPGLNLPTAELVFLTAAGLLFAGSLRGARG